MRKPISRAHGETIGWPRSDCAIIPKKQKDETRFDSFKHNLFETALRLFAPRLADSRMTAAKTLLKSQAAGLRLRRKVVDHSVHSSPCALHDTVRNVLSGDRRVFRHMSRRANRPRLHASSANGEREND